MIVFDHDLFANVMALNGLDNILLNSPRADIEQVQNEKKPFTLR